jgi:hypothetical protein
MTYNVHVVPIVKPPPLIVVPDVERLYIDLDCRAHRVEDLDPVLRLEVEQALALAHDYRITMELEAARGRIEILEADV